MEYSHPPDLGQVEHRMAPHGTDTRQSTREGPVQSEPSSALDSTTTTVLYKVVLFADNGGNTKPLEG
jgi:hypothetical protein